MANANDKFQNAFATATCADLLDVSCGSDLHALYTLGGKPAATRR
jgi:hypothetical protein